MMDKKIGKVFFHYFVKNHYRNRGLCWVWWYLKWLESQQDDLYAQYQKLQQELYYDLVNNAPKRSNQLLEALIRYFSCIDQGSAWNKKVLDTYQMQDYEKYWEYDDFYIGRYKLEKQLLVSILEITKTKNLIKEYSIGLLLTFDQIVQLLSIKDFIKDKRLILFESVDTDEYSALFKDKDQYFYFTASDKTGIKETQLSGVDKIAASISTVHSSCLGIVEGGESKLQFEKYYGLGIKVFTFGEDKIEYPDQKKILEFIKPTISCNNYSSLSVAAKVGSLESVTYFLQKGADPNVADKEGNTPLIFASKRDNIDIVEKLLLVGADPNVQNKENFTPLCYASYYNNPKIVKILLAARANPNLANENTCTALEYAAKAGYTEIVKSILVTRANINMPVWNDKTALVRALKYKHFDVVGLLLEAGFNYPNAQDEDGRTALMYATMYKDIKLVKKLLAMDADPDIQDCIIGYSALMYASEIGNAEIVKALMSNDTIKVNLVDTNGLTAYDLAKTGEIKKLIAHN